MVHVFLGLRSDSQRLIRCGKGDSGRTVRTLLQGESLLLLRAFRTRTESNNACRDGSVGRSHDHDEFDLVLTNHLLSCPHKIWVHDHTSGPPRRRHYRPPNTPPCWVRMSWQSDHSHYLNKINNTWLQLER